jgi:hypothetical protein
MKDFYGPFAPQVKLLLILRNPVDRMLSWFRHFQPADYPVFDDYAMEVLLHYCTVHCTLYTIHYIHTTLSLVITRWR